jgi:hypothetical protein
VSINKDFLLNSFENDRSYDLFALALAHELGHLYTKSAKKKGLLTLEWKFGYQTWVSLNENQRQELFSDWLAGCFASRARFSIVPYKNELKIASNKLKDVNSSNVSQTHPKLVLRQRAVDLGFQFCDGGAP